MLISRLLVGISLVALLAPGASAQATAPGLGTAANFAVLGASTVTNTGPTVITGDLGVSPGTAITGRSSIVLTGTVHDDDAVAAQAQHDVTTAYGVLAGEPCGADLSGQDLGGLTLTPGVYCFSAAALLTGVLTLDAEGDPNAVFVFQIGSALTTESGSLVTVINGGADCNVYWQVGSSATLGTGSTFVGNILALASITLTTAAHLNGRALAQTGAVTLDTNVVSASTCSPAPPISVVIKTTPSSFRCSDANAIVTVVIESTATFDALTINPNSLRFGESGTEAHIIPGKTTYVDFNHDGRLDLAVRFRLGDTGFDCSDVGPSCMTKVTGFLTGLTLDGTPIEGSTWFTLHH